MKFLKLQYSNRLSSSQLFRGSQYFDVSIDSADFVGSMSSINNQKSKYVCVYVWLDSGLNKI